AADARRVADVLDIPFHAVNFQRDFDRIVDYFVGEYAAGRTPNPCIVCNSWLKFGRLFEYADGMGAEYVATGHYARLVALEGGEIALCRARDESKDQSYALFGIRRDFLPRLMFPVGEHRKEEIRRIAGRLGLRVAEKRDSQEICFVPDRDHARFVRQRRGHVDTSGEIVATDGTLLGRHEGIEQFTVGQRKGLRLAIGEPRYVVRIEADSRRVVIGAHEELARRELTASGANWLIEECGGRRAECGDEPILLGAEVPAPLPSPLSPPPSPPSPLRPPPSALCSPSLGPFRAQVKIRYRSRPTDATVEPLPEDRFRVRFDEPCFGVAPGQAAVCYDGKRVLGGGWID
ncbi:MAG: tRNA-specific 2-thiouridylase, partial [Planctomycetales bacterium]|nr:tRNA-specific 2-thiouridylase [Planctomycetales bacterium]